MEKYRVSVKVERHEGRRVTTRQTTSEERWATVTLVTVTGENAESAVLAAQRHLDIEQKVMVEQRMLGAAGGQHEAPEEEDDPDEAIL
jgi:hypothetical protein